MSDNLPLLMSFPTSPASEMIPPNENVSRTFVRFFKPDTQM